MPKTKTARPTLLSSYLSSFFALSAITAGALLAGCTDPADPDATNGRDELDGRDGTEAPAAPAAHPSVTITSVVENRDGTFTVTTRPYSAEEERRQREQRARQAAGELDAQIAQEPCTNGAAFWLYEQQGWTGNKICFLGAGSVTLANFERLYCPSATTCWRFNWQISSGSYWAGASGGHLYDSWSGRPFAAYGRDNFSQYTATYLQLDQ